MEETGKSIVDKTIDEQRDFRQIGLMFGFDDDSFEGEFSKALSVYQWAKENTKNSDDAMMLIAHAIAQTGSSTRGKNLLKKVYEWTSLEEGIKSLIKRQEALGV